MASESEAINIMEGIRIQMSRNRTIDVAKAIGIILVIMEHLVVYQGRAFTLISAFSMPLFFSFRGTVLIHKNIII